MNNERSALAVGCWTLNPKPGFGSNQAVTEHRPPRPRVDANVAFGIHRSIFGASGSRRSSFLRGHPERSPARDRGGPDVVEGPGRFLERSAFNVQFSVQLDVGRWTLDVGRWTLD